MLYRKKNPPNNHVFLLANEPHDLTTKKRQIEYINFTSAPRPF